MDDDAVLGAELAAVVAGARRRALRDGDRQIDTAHLLHSLLEHDSEVRAAVGAPERLARLLGYLVQRSIGYGLRWQGSVEDSGALAVVTAPTVPGVRDAPDASGARDARDTPAWSPAAAAAIADAHERARHRGEPRPAGTDLLAALTADPGTRAVEVLERAGIPAHALGTRIETGPEEYAGDSGVNC
ncbi:Clp protease N-terminal domain-containing protein [Streptomyces camelliae]|uniref:Peptidase n=1 Tax=Streptomyces camelliae TaxID=3004093 RepID=A0ABY7PH63_9ACTN|nr:Clp protease N-terminal domain-containing protein [Streptomyces sp. HUAS 2-6]WBO67668.1 peptidase [Streptomyces sp. HUAS 2-6]